MKATTHLVFKDCSISRGQHSHNTLILLQLRHISHSVSCYVKSIMMKIVVFAPHSLFADGIASYFLTHPIMFETYFVDASHIDAFEKILEIRPNIILVDSTDDILIENNTILRILEILPQGIVLQLDYDNTFVRIFSSQQRKADQISDLIAIIQELTPISRKMINA